MDLTGVIIGSVAGIFLGPVAGIEIAGMSAATSGALVGAGLGHTFYDQPRSIKKAQKESRESQEALATEQAKAAARARAVAQAPISAEQMQKVIQQRELGSLVDHYIAQESEGPQIYTLPTAQPSSPVVRANIAIHKFLTGVA